MLVCLLFRKGLENPPGLFFPFAGTGINYVFDGDGHSHPWGIWFNAHLFTPTGLPIEHEASGEVAGVGAVSIVDKVCHGTNTLDVTFSKAFNSGV